MSKEKVCQRGVAIQSLTQLEECILAHLIMAHEYLLNLLICLQCLRNRCDLPIFDLVLKQIKISKRQNVEKLSQSISTNLIVIDVDIAKVLFTLEHFDEITCPIVVNFVI